MANARKYLLIIGVIGLAILSSCNGFGLVYKRPLTGNYYLTAVDDKAEINVSYKIDRNSYMGVVNKTIFAAGFNKDFIIAASHHAGGKDATFKDTVNYYIINVNKTNALRAAFVKTIDTIRYSTLYKDRNGHDSAGPMKIQVTKSSFTPPVASPLTYDEFLHQRKLQNVPDSLVFTITFKDLQGH